MTQISVGNDGPQIRFHPDFSPIDGTHAFIQWKGTDVCLDFTCECGAGGHYDGYFAYRLRCTACGKVWATPHSVSLVPSQYDPSDPVIDIEPQNDEAPAPKGGRS